MAARCVEALGALNRRGESSAIRQQLFEKSLAVADLQEWLDDLPPQEQPAAMRRARDVALQAGAPIPAAQLLLALGEDESAETVLVKAAKRLPGRHYTTLVALARDLDGRERWRGATCLYRVLLDDVLTRAYAAAYPHGANYCLRLRAIAASGIDLAPLQAHADYVVQVEKQHRRKSRFWTCVAEAEAGRG